jgi:cephalosporin hydroxylase
MLVHLYPSVTVGDYVVVEDQALSEGGAGKGMESAIEVIAS